MDNNSDNKLSLLTRLALAGVLLYLMAWTFDVYIQPATGIDLRSVEFEAQQFANRAIAETGAKIW